MQRLLTALVLAVLFLAAVFLLPPSWFFLFVLLFGELAVLEFISIARSWSRRSPQTAMLLTVPLASAALAVALSGGSAEVAVEAVVTAAVVLSIGGAVTVLLTRTPVEQSLPAMGILAFGTLYLTVPLVCIWGLQRTDPWWVVLLVVLVTANDSAAFYVGKAIGERKMAPVVSPNKTWEGAAAGLVAGPAAAAAWSWFRYGEVLPALVALALLATVAAQCGDLVESMLKRGAGTKDSGTLLPGHGGILDRIDALLFATPVLFLGLVWLGLVELP